MIVTGASSGIGRATALAFAARGARILLAARRRRHLEEAAADCRKRGGEAFAVPLDVTDPDAVEALARQAVERFGRIDVWVNNAAVSLLGRFDEVPLASHRRVVEVNLLGCINGAHAALKRFRTQRRGVLINVASQLAYVGQPYAGAYVATKYAIRGLGESLRQELGDTPHIHVSTVLPGSTDTPLFQHLANYTGRAIKPLSPIVGADEVARIIVDVAARPRHEAIVGGARVLPLAKAVAPAAMERIVRGKTERDHFRNGAAPVSPGNLFEPIDDAATISGGWRDPSPPLRLQPLLGIGIAVIALSLLRLLVRRPRRRGYTPNA